MCRSAAKECQVIPEKTKVVDTTADVRYYCIYLLTYAKLCCYYQETKSPREFLCEADPGRGAQLSGVCASETWVR